MRIRSFQAPTMKDAIALVREELGADAIILSSYERRRGGGVEVRAAVDQEAGRPDPGPTPGDLGLSVSEIEARLRAQLAAEMDRAGVKAHAPADAAPPDKAELRKTMESVLEILAAHGLPKARRAPLLAAAKDAGSKDPVAALGSALTRHLHLAPAPLAKGQTLMLVGPPGTGKTVTAAKLAARRVLGGQPIALATTDTIRAGAVPQLEALAAILGQAIATADSPARLAEIARDCGDTPLIVDTPATNPFNAGEMRDLARFIRASEGEAVLVLAGGADLDECVETAGLYKALGVSRLLITRMDATRRLGGALAAALEHTLPLAEFGTSPYVADGLKAYDPRGLAVALAAMARSETGSPTHSETDPAPRVARSGGANGQ